MSTRMRFAFKLLAFVIVAGMPLMASAQFLGDAIAAAGGAATEMQVAEYAQATGRISGAPTLVTVPVQSSGPTSMPSTDPGKLGTDIRQPEMPGGGASTGGSTTSGTGSVASSGSGSTGGGSYPAGGGTTIAGPRLQAEALNPADVEAWKNAFKPVGTNVKALPKDAATIGAGGKTYYYQHGVFMEKTGATYTVVPAPEGAVLSQKPVGAATAFANGKPYIYYYGTFFVYDSEAKGYVVVKAPAGARIQYLPDGATKEQWNGELHYKYAGTYYKPFYQGSSLVFVVAG